MSQLHLQPPTKELAVQACEIVWQIAAVELMNDGNKAIDWDIIDHINVTRKLIKFENKLKISQSG